MKPTITIPSQFYFIQAKKIITQAINNLPPLYRDYYHVNDIITDSTPELQQLVNQQTGLKKFKISAGTSDMLAFKPYLSQIIQDIKQNAYYRNYNNPLGNTTARSAIALMENAKFDTEPVYTYKDVGLTTGSTGAISQIFEYVKQAYPNSEVIIASPTYYLYKYLAKFFKLKYQEAFNIKINTNSNTVSFNSIPDILRKISPKTKLVVIVKPNNPSSELYPSEDVKKLLVTCKNKGILVLTDELFTDLLFDAKNFIPTDVLAQKVDALNNLVLVRGYSKSKNLPGFRIGYLLSKNKQLMTGVEQISEQRQCFASSSNYTGLIIQDSFIQTVKATTNKGVTLNRSINLARKKFDQFNLKISGNLYTSYANYMTRIKKTYSDYYDQSLATLNQEVVATTPKASAFNTFVKIKDMPEINFLDFCLNFYLCCNIVTQIGPCFAFNQSTWENDLNLGFWLRLSYSREDKNYYMLALKKFSEFKKIYLSSPDKFLKLGLSF